MPIAFTEAFKKSLIPQIRTLRAEGFTTAEIATKLKVSTSVIEVLVRENKLPPSPIHKVSPERMKQLNNAAKKYGFKDFDSIKDRATKLNVARDATRRAEGIATGSGRPDVLRTKAEKTAIKKSHWMKGLTKAERTAAIQKQMKPYWDQKTAIQRNILDQIDNKVFNSKKIAKNLGISHKNLIREGEKLFKNVYANKLQLNKGATPTSSFLPGSVSGLNKVLDKLWKVEGFGVPEAQTWFKLVRDAKEEGRLTASQFKKATADVKNFYDMKNVIQKKYPSIILNLDHPLSRGALTMLNAKGEKFLTGIPTTERFNKGIKQRIDLRYKSLIGDVRKGVTGAGEKKAALETLAKELKIDIGGVSKTGKKITSLGEQSVVLGKTPLGKGIIEGLEKQNILAKDLKNIRPELLEAAGMDSYFKKTRLPEISARTIEGIRQLFNEGSNSLKNKTAVALGCIGKAEGGRIGYALGSATINCVNTKLTNEPVQSSLKLKATEGIGKIRGAATSFLGMLGRGGARAAPYAALAAVGAGIEPLVKQFVADDPNTYLTNENQMKGMLLATLEGEPPKVDEEILKWQMPALGAATAAGAIPGAGAVYKARRGIPEAKFVGPMQKGVGPARAALGLKGVLGKALGASFSPLAVAATLPISVAAQKSGGTDYGDIATDPFNWMGPAFASTGAEMASKGIKNPMILKALRLGMSPRTLSMVSRRFGLPGLAISAGMWGYDKWKNRSINDPED